MSGLYSAAINPNITRRATFFFDGSNFIVPCLRQEWVVSTKLIDLCVSKIRGKATLHRVYVYCTKRKMEKFTALNPDFFSGCQIIYGHEVEDEVTGKILKEKGVDALLVADLIYHSAMKNCEIAIVGTRDNDFMYALRRAQDFGVSVGIFNIIETPTAELLAIADHEFQFHVAANQLGYN